MRAEIEKAVSKMVEQDVSQLDLGPEPEVDLPPVSTGTVPFWTLRVVMRRREDENYVSATSPLTRGSLTAIARSLIRDRLVPSIEAGAITFIRSLRAAPEIDSVHVLGSWEDDVEYVYALGRGAVSLERMSDAIETFQYRQ